MKYSIMEWMILIMLILIGFILLVLEFLIFPGVNIAGIIGFVCICLGIYLGYNYFGTETGHLIVLGTVLGGIVLTWYVLRTNTWKRFSLNSQIDSKVDGVDESVRAGDIGICIGRLAPMGKVKVGDAVVEAASQSGYINENSRVEVIKVYKDKIIVKLITAKDGE